MSHNTVNLELPNSVGHYAVVLYRIKELLNTSKRSNALTDSEHKLLNQLYNSLSNASYDAHMKGSKHSTYKEFSGSGFTK